MKILFDHQIFENQNLGGISKYFCELIKGMQINDEPILSLKYSNNIYLKEILNKEIKPLAKVYLSNSKFSYIPRFTQWSLKKIGIIKDRSASNLMNSITHIVSENYNVFHPTYYDDYFIEFAKNKKVKYVLTVHDLIHELYPEFFKLNDDFLNKKRNLIDNSNAIIAISNKTKNDLIEFYGVPEKKIKVVYHAYSFRSNIPVGIKLFPEKYIFYVGSRENYKNFYFFLLSILSILKKDKDINIVCTGTKFSEQELKFFEFHNVLDKLFCFQVNEEELAYLYKNALLFVFPSLYEGFGLPILEAFANGCPVVSSNGGSLPEVGGDAALYFDPKSKQQLVDIIESLIESPSLRKSMIEKGYNRVKDFSWEKTVQETLKVYKNLI